MKKLKAITLKLMPQSRLMHYLDMFIAAFVVALGANEQHILDAHGLNAWKSVVEAAAVVAGKAVIEAYRKNTPGLAPAAPTSTK